MNLNNDKSQYCILNNCNNLHQKNLEFKREISKIVGEFNNKINKSYDNFYYNNIKDKKYIMDIGKNLIDFYDNFYKLMKDYFKNINEYSNCILNNCDAKTYYDLLNKNKFFINHFNNELNEMFNIISSKKQILINKTQQSKFDKKITMIKNLIEVNMNKMLIIKKK
jgi:hypothetical protein